MKLIRAAALRLRANSIGDTGGAWNEPSYHRTHDPRPVATSPYRDSFSIDDVLAYSLVSWTRPAGGLYSQRPRARQIEVRSSAASATATDASDSQSLGLDLPDALTRHREPLTDFLQRVVGNQLHILRGFGIGIGSSFGLPQLCIQALTSSQGTPIRVRSNSARRRLSSSRLLATKRLPYSPITPPLRG